MPITYFILIYIFLLILIIKWLHFILLKILLYVIILDSRIYTRYIWYFYLRVINNSLQIFEFMQLWMSIRNRQNSILLADLIFLIIYNLSILLIVNCCRFLKFIIIILVFIFFAYQTFILIFIFLFFIELIPIILNIKNLAVTNLHYMHLFNQTFIFIY